MTNGIFDITFVTYSELPELDCDDRLALDALARRRMRTQVAVWDNPAIDWENAGICVIRSTWDYHLRRQDFLEWANRVAKATVLINDVETVEWNSHKTYLRDLQRRGVPVVPTDWAKMGSHADLGAIMRENAWADVIIKPAVGLATFGVRRVGNTPGKIREGQAHLDILLRANDAMIQPYYSSVSSYGERSLIFLGGEYSHCVRKAAFQVLAEAGKAGEKPCRAYADEVETAAMVINALDRPPLYARVDLVRDDIGVCKLLELELVEPSLFLAMHEPAAERFADILSRVRKQPLAAVL